MARDSVRRWAQVAVVPCTRHRPVLWAALVVVDVRLELARDCLLRERRPQVVPVLVLVRLRAVPDSATYRVAKKKAQ